MARFLWPVRSMATAIAAEARAPRRPPLRVARVQPEEPILQHGMQPLVWGGDSHFDHLDRQSLLAEGEGGGLGGHPNVESVVVFSVQPVVALVRPVPDADLRPKGQGAWAGDEAVEHPPAAGRDERIPPRFIRR